MLYAVSQNRPVLACYIFDIYQSVLIILYASKYSVQVFIISRHSHFVFETRYAA